MYKLIVSDLDETLLNDAHEICDKNKEYIAKATRMGIKFIPATGRGYSGITNVLKALDLYDKEEEYVVSFNGGALTENKNNRVMNFDGLSFEKAKELFEFGLLKNQCMHIYTKDTVYLCNLNEDERNRFINQKSAFIELEEKSIDFLKNEPIAKVIYQNLDTDYLKELSKEMLHITENEVSVNYSSNRYMELNKIGVNKGDAVLKLAALLGVKQEEIIVAGDNYNDVSMLEIAGLSVAAGNAVDDVKKICDYVCENDNNQGVIAEIIEKFILNK